MTSQIDNVLIQVRALLRTDGIKLWMEPYYLAGVECCEIELERLAKNFNTTLDIPFKYCLAALKELQSYSLDKLRAKEVFQKTGVATVKVKVIYQNNNGRTISLNVRLTDTGNDLIEKIAHEIKVDSTKLKAICSGKVLQLQYILSEQGVTNNQQIMALVMDQYAGNTNTESKTLSVLRMEDQRGNVTYLVLNQKKSLMALLHEKGRAAMKHKQYNKALILFLEADEKYSSCNPNSNDNYALLNLDIVWCYLCLNSITYLPDAQRRLSICADNFRSCENRRALMRLHLLQGIMLFHQNFRNEAKEKLDVAQSELTNLKVDEMAVIEAVPDIFERHSNTIDFLNNRRDELANEKPTDILVDQDLINMVVKMGFVPEKVKIALKLARNNVERTIDILLKMPNVGNTNANVTNDSPKPSTSKNVQIEPFTNEVEARQAYDRFAQEIPVEDDEYLDLTLDQEEKTLLQYKRFLN